jgi:hypothetical protein
MQAAVGAMHITLEAYLSGTALWPMDPCRRIPEDAGGIAGIFGARLKTCARGPAVGARTIRALHLRGPHRLSWRAESVGREPSCHLVVILGLH